MATFDELAVKAEQLKTILISRATGGLPDDHDYDILRRELIGDARLRSKIPRVLLTCRNPQEVWTFIQPKFKHYQQRRDYLREQSELLLAMLEAADSAPSSDANSEVLTAVDSAHVKEAWFKALDRRRDDPDGAITAARTLLESVCKFILDQRSVEYDDKADLPKLFGMVAKELDLSPSQHTEQVIKQILGGCAAVVEGLGALRIRLSDAHGKGKSGVKAQPRHAALAVNLSGSLATFLIETWELRSNPG